MILNYDGTESFEIRLNPIALHQQETDGYSTLMLPRCWSKNFYETKDMKKISFFYYSRKAIRNYCYKCESRSSISEDDPDGRSSVMKRTLF